MNGKDSEELLARRLAGEDLTHGEPQISYEPIQPAGHPDGDMKIGKSLRVPLAMFEQISAVAERRRMCGAHWCESGSLKGWHARMTAKSTQSSNYTTISTPPPKR
jgi:hypothetical protein